MICLYTQAIPSQINQLSMTPAPGPIIDLENAPLNGSILVKVLVLSIDPYIRGKMRPEHITYAPAYHLGKPCAYKYHIGRTHRLALLTLFDNISDHTVSMDMVLGRS